MRIKLLRLKDLKNKKYQNCTYLDKRTGMRSLELELEIEIV